MIFYGEKKSGTIIDFEADFNKYAKNWLKNNPVKVDSYEGAVSQTQLIYEDWVRTPMKELEGETPKEFFDQITDIDNLLDLVVEYGDLGEGKVPRVLLNRILAFGEEAVEPLIELAGDEELWMCDSRGSGRGSIVAVKLLGQLRSPKGIPVLVDIIDKREGMDIIGDTAIRALEAIGEEVIEPVLAALEKTKNESAVTSFASVLATVKGDERIFQVLTELFKKGGDGYELFGGLLVQYGDDRALPILQEALKDPGLSYLGFREIASAIEELGGTVEIQRDFSADPWFQMQQQFRNLAAHHEQITAMAKPVSTVKIGRNEACPCGSGKKYKKCCGRG